MSATETTTTTKKKKKNFLTFAQLIARIKRAGGEDKQIGLNLLRTAASSGWLTDRVFFTRLTDAEQTKVKELVREIGKSKEGKELKNVPLFDIAKVFPDVVGPMVDVVKQVGNRVRLTTPAGTTALVDAVLFTTLRKRHPDATVYLDSVNPVNGPVVFSSKNTVAVLGTDQQLG